MQSIGALSMTAFFVGSLVMRFCGPLILKVITVRKAYILFGFLYAVLTVALLLITIRAVMIPLAVISGFMQGSCVAFLVLMCTEALPNRIASASSLAFMGAYAATMTAPFWMGAIAEYTGFRFPLLLGCALMFVSVFLVIRIGKQKVVV